MGRSLTLGTLCKYLIILAVLICSCSQFCVSLQSPALPSTLVQKLHRLAKITSFAANRSRSSNDSTSRQWSRNFNRNILNSNVLFENVLQSYLKSAFKPGEFREFAKTTLFHTVSDECRSHFLEFLSQIFWSIPEGLFEEPETWVLQMADSWGKFPAGILSGHTAVPGDYSECVQLRGNYSDTIFKGKYCATYLAPGEALLKWLEDHETKFNVKEASTFSVQNVPEGSNVMESVSPEELIAFMFTNVGKGINFFPFVGTCFPSSCSMEDAQTILTNFYKEATKGFLEQSVAACYTDEKLPLDAGDISIISLLSIIGFLCLLGSLFDILILRRQFDPKLETSLSLPGKLLLAFSVPLNNEKLLNTKVGSDNLGCLHGLRFLSMAWVLLGHTWVMNMLQLSWNLIDIQNLDREWTLLAVINGTLAVDTFFTMSGTLIAYNLLRELDKNKGRFNYPMLVLHRILRLTPTYLIVVGILATIVPYLGSGPLWFMMEYESEICEKNWWYNVLYINNFMNQNEICYGESWYLGNDMQFFLLAPLIIYPLWKERKIGCGILGALCIASIIAPALITHEKELPPTIVLSIPQKSYMEDIYFKPWTRMGPYLVGIFLGFILHWKAQSPKSFRTIPLWAILFGWFVSTATALLIIFGAKDFFDPANEVETLTSIKSAVYSGLHRFAWGVVIAWIIFACVSGYGGWVNKFLSWKVFVPLGRLTFCVYVSSYHIQKLYHFSAPHPSQYSTYTSVNMFFAHAVMCCLVGYVLTITLESPFIQLEKLLLPTKKRHS